jgi:hypothetical protein
MINLIFRLFLTFNATSLIIVVYLVKDRFVLSKIFSCLSVLPDYISYLFYFSIPVILTLLSLFIANWLDNDSIEIENTGIIFY